MDADKVYTGGKDGVLRTWTAVAKDNGAVELQADLNVDIGVEVTFCLLALYHQCLARLRLLSFWFLIP